MISRIIGAHHIASACGDFWLIRTRDTDIAVDVAVTHSEACSTILLLDRMVDALGAALDAIGA